MITLDEIRRRLVESIRESGMTQTELARLLHISPATISHYMRGDKLPAPRYACQPVPHPRRLPPRTFSVLNNKKETELSFRFFFVLLYETVMPR